jgi:hypothetical protein
VTTPQHQDPTDRKPTQQASIFIQMNGGQERIRTSEVERQRIYSPPHLAALEPAPVMYHRLSAIHHSLLDNDLDLSPEPEKGLEPPTS